MFRIRKITNPYLEGNKQVMERIKGDIETGSLASMHVLFLRDFTKSILRNIRNKLKEEIREFYILL